MVLMIDWQIERRLEQEVHEGYERITRAEGAGRGNVEPKS